MRKGTTPTLTFRLPFEVDLLSNAKVTFSQGGNVILEKKLCDCDASQNLLSVTLSQEETFLFECDSVAQVQLRCVTPTGEAFASAVFTTFIARSLDSEVLQ